jgi:hypothetical protein
MGRRTKKGVSNLANLARGRRAKYKVTEEQHHEFWIRFCESMNIDVPHDARFLLPRVLIIRVNEVYDVQSFIGGNAVRLAEVAAIPDICMAPCPRRDLFFNFSPTFQRALQQGYLRGLQGNCITYLLLKKGSVTCNVTLCNTFENESIVCCIYSHLCI